MLWGGKDFGEKWRSKGGGCTLTQRPTPCHTNLFDSEALREVGGAAEAKPIRNRVKVRCAVGYGFKPVALAITKYETGYKFRSEIESPVFATLWNVFHVLTREPPRGTPFGGVAAARIG